MRCHCKLERVQELAEALPMQVNPSLIPPSVFTWQ